MVGHHVDSPAGARIERGLVSKLMSTIFFLPTPWIFYLAQVVVGYFTLSLSSLLYFFSGNKISTTPEKSSH